MLLWTACEHSLWFVAQGGSSLVSSLAGTGLNSLDYAGLMAPPQRPVQTMTRQAQTDLTINKIKELESKSALDLEMRDNRIDELQRVRWSSLFPLCW